MFLTVLAVAAAGLVAAACATDDASDRNERIVLAMIEAVNERDFDALDAVVATGMRRHSAATPDVKVESLDDFKAFLEADLATFPDSRMTVNQLVADDEMVAVHATYAGTQQGPMGPFPASGNRMELPFMGMLRIEDGKIAEMWVEWDNLNALTQLGHFPPPGAPAPSP